MKLWTAADIAKAFGVCQRTVVDRWSKRPDFPRPAVRINQKTVRWRIEDVQRWATGERQ